MYLGHLVESRGITVYDARSGAIVFWASESTVRELIKDGKAQAKLSRTRIQRIEWIGRPFPATWRLGARAEDQHGGSDVRNKTHYSFDHATEDNPVNVWALYELEKWMGAIFLGPMVECGAALVRQELIAVVCKHCKGAGYTNPAALGRLSLCPKCHGRRQEMRSRDVEVTIEQELAG